MSHEDEDFLIYSLGRYKISCKNGLIQILKSMEMNLNVHTKVHGCIGNVQLHRSLLSLLSVNGVNTNNGNDTITSTPDNYTISCY